MSFTNSESSETADAVREKTAVTVTDYSISVHWLCLCNRLFKKHEISETVRQTNSVLSKYLKQYNKVVSADWAVDLWFTDLSLS